MNKHTPGPWSWRFDGLMGVYADANGHCVADCGSTSEEHNANARLIAAAPDLLEALRWYIQNDDTNLGQEGNEFWEEGYNRAVAVVAKAEGDAAMYKERLGG